MANSTSKTADFTEKAEAFYATFHRLRQQVINHWWILLLAVALGLLIETLVTMRLQSFYRSEGKIISGSSLVISEAVGSSAAEGDFVDTQIELMESEVVRTRAEAMLSATKPELVHSDAKVTVDQLSKTSIFTLSAVGKDKEYTRCLLDAVMEQYLQFRKEQGNKSTGVAELAIEKKMEDTQQAIDDEEAVIKTWQEKNSLPALQEEGNYAAKYVAGLKQTLAESQTEYDLLGNLSLDQSLDRQKDAADPTGLTSAATEGKIQGVALDYLQAKRQVLLDQARREELSQFLKPKHPIIINLTDKIAQGVRTIQILRDQAIEQLKTQRESIRIQMENTKKQIVEWEPKAVELGARISEFGRMNEKLTRAKNDLLESQTLLSQLTTKREVEPENMSIMSRASEAEPIRQGVFKALAIGILGGLVVGAGILLLINQFDDRIRSFSELQSTFSEPIIGHIPKSDITDQPLLVDNDSRHMLFESLRNIRSSITFMPYEGARPKTLLFTSSIPNEGKSTVSSNFAVTLAMSGSKILLIDADMRRGGLHNFFQMESGPGLTELLSGEIALDKTIRQTKVPNLEFIPRGKGTLRANDLLLGKETDQLIKKIYSRYDYIVFDSAPVLATDDTSNLAPKVDGTIFVVRASFTQARLARRTLQLLKDRQVNILGLIFNCANTSSADYPYYRYEEYHKQPVS